MDQDINDLLYDTDDLKKEKVNGGFFDFIKAWFYNDVERHMFFEDEIIVAQKLKTMDVMANTYALERKKYFEDFLEYSHKQKSFLTRIKDRDFAFYKDPTRVRLWSSITDTDVYSFFIKSSINQMLGGGNIAQLTSLPKFKFNAILSVNSENISAAASLAATGEKSFAGSSCINIWSNLPVFDSKRGDVKSFIPLYLRMSGKASSALFSYDVDIGSTTNRLKFTDSECIQLLNNFKGNINLKLVTAKGSREAKSLIYTPKFKEYSKRLNDLGFILNVQQGSYRYLVPETRDGLDLIREYTYPEIEQIYFGRSALSGYSKSNYDRQSLGIEKNGEGLMTLGVSSKDYENPLIQVKTSTKTASFDLLQGEIKGKILADSLIGFADVKGAVNKFRNQVDSIVKNNIAESFESPFKIPNLSEFSDMEIKARFGLYSKKSASKLRTIRISIPMTTKMLDFNQTSGSYNTKSGMGYSMAQRHELKGTTAYKQGLLENSTQRLFSGESLDFKNQLRSMAKDLTKDYVEFGNCAKDKANSLIENISNADQHDFDLVKSTQNSALETMQDSSSSIYDKGSTFDSVIDSLRELYKLKGENLTNIDSNDILNVLSQNSSLAGLSSSIGEDLNKLNSKFKDITSIDIKKKASEEILSTSYQQYNPSFNKAKIFNNPDSFYVQDTLINYSQTLKKEEFRDQMSTINIIEFGNDSHLPILFNLCKMMTSESGKDEAKDFLNQKENANKTKELINTLENTATVISPESNISYTSINVLCNKGVGSIITENNKASSVSLGSTVSLAGFNRMYSLDSRVSMLGVSPLEELSNFSAEKNKYKITFEEYFTKLAIQKYIKVVMIDDEASFIRTFVSPMMECQKKLLDNLVILNKVAKWKSSSSFKRAFSSSGSFSFTGWLKERLPGFDFEISQEYAYFTGLVINFTFEEDNSSSETVIKLCKIIKSLDRLVRGFYLLLRRMVKNRNARVGSHNVSESHLNMVKQILTSLYEPYEVLTRKISDNAELLSALVNMLSFMDSFVEVQQLCASICIPNAAFFTLVNENKSLLKDICYTVEKSGVTGVIVESIFSYSSELFKEGQQEIKLNIKKMPVRVRDGKVKKFTSIDRDANTEAILQSIYDNIIALDEQDLERLFMGFRILKQENSTNTDKTGFNIGLIYHPITNDVSIEINKDQQSSLYSYSNLSKDAYIRKIKSIVDAKIALTLSFEHEEIRSSQGFSVLAIIPAKGHSIDELNRKYRPMIWV
ncbi:Pathogenicity determinant protein D [Francisella hispaniensis]|uniref:Pathogenicity determinant protein D n=1 Tax=Francisella hispaniensis FSC454 TaxID=1088883 RepID=A0AAC9J708_9GAMM|nr:Pathogenicity determinant protein D [Francisella hispaniensis]APD50226.1 Pathogenicity determinant protein D [Francisella hispaniensis FSC454]KYW82482.1 Pathogenicity determinant protein D [Francisella hispaniensis FSC454]